MRQPSTDFLYFNPRLREGGDIWLSWISVRFRISIHASEKEATFSSGKSSTLQGNFNPRLREGGDHSLRHTHATLLISIHASEKEATWVITKTKQMIEFQSTPPRRRRLQHIVIPQLSCTYLVSTTFLSAIFSFISQYIVLFFLF